MPFWLSDFKDNNNSNNHNTEEQQQGKANRDCALACHILIYAVTNDTRNNNTNRIYYNCNAIIKQMSNAIWQEGDELTGKNRELQLNMSTITVIDGMP